MRGERTVYVCGRDTIKQTHEGTLVHLRGTNRIWLLALFTSNSDVKDLFPSVSCCCRHSHFGKFPSVPATPSPASVLENCMNRRAVMKHASYNARYNNVQPARSTGRSAKDVHSCRQTTTLIMINDRRVCAPGKGHPKGYPTQVKDFS